VGNSRQIVRKTLQGLSPPRIACSFPGADIEWVYAEAKTYATDWADIGGGWFERYDVWGNQWRRCDPTSKGEVTRGVIADISETGKYEMPDFSDIADYAIAKAKRQEMADKWILGGVEGLTFSVARKLLKLEDYLCCLITDKDEVSKLHDRIDEQIENMVRNFAAIGVDGIMFWEDWGTQERLLISPATWEDEFYPRFEKICNLAHGLGLKVFMHSCGAIGAIVPLLAKAGVDVLQFDQPLLHGIEMLAEYQQKYGLTFWCPADVQKSLTTGDQQQIRAHAGELVDKLWQNNGKFIAGYYGDPLSLGIDPAWQDWASDEFLKRGKI
jgi:uroporphyrinogen decarboxylase